MRQIILLLLAVTAHAADYPVGYLHVPRDPAVPKFAPQSFSEVNGPYVTHRGTSLSIIEPDGTKRLLVNGVQGALTAVHDWSMSLDGQSVYYSHVGAAGCDLYKIPLAGGPAVKLTDCTKEWNPPAGVYPAGTKLPVWNTAPCDTPEGLVFCSDRDGIRAPGEIFRAFLLYRIRPDGVTERMDHMNFGGVLHPHYFKGWVYFASNQQQGLRGRAGSGWAIWRIKPDGSSFEPSISSIPVFASIGPHNTTHTTDGTLLSDYYYDSRAIGMILACPPFEPTPFGPPTQFDKPGANDNPFFWNGWNARDGRASSINAWRIGFTPRGTFSPFPWAMHTDWDNWTTGGEGTGLPPQGKQGEVGHPWAVPGNRFTVAWTGDNDDHRNWGIYLSTHLITEKPPAPGDVALPSEKPRDYLTVVVDDPDMHEWYGKAAVSYSALYGAPPPAMHASPKATTLPAASPYGLIGSTSVDQPEVVNDDVQGSIITEQVHIDATKVHFIRVLGFNPTQFNVGISPPLSNVADEGPYTVCTEGFSSAVNERMGIYADIPVRKWTKPDGSLHVGPNPPAGSTPLLAPDGRPDTSFAAYFPANQPFSFQLLDDNKRAIKFATARTWHQIIPLEQRTNCQGCHDHNQPDKFEWKDSAAARPDYPLLKLDKLRKVEYHRDVKAIDESLSLGLGMRPFTKPGGPKVFRSSEWPVLDDPRLTAAQRQTLAEWCDTGFMAATTLLDGTPITEASRQGPFADGLPPTLAAQAFSDRFVIGAADPDSGLDWSTLKVTRDGAEVAATVGGEFATVAGAPSGKYVASIRDRQGNLGTLTLTVAGDLPDACAEEIRQLQQQVAALQAEVARLKSVLATIHEASKP